MSTHAPNCSAAPVSKPTPGPSPARPYEPPTLLVLGILEVVAGSAGS